MPAYVIFTDKTLDDLIERRPTTLAELGACHGIGPAKLEAFGDELLAVIAGREATSGTEGAEPPDRPEPDRTACPRDPHPAPRTWPNG